MRMTYSIKDYWCKVLVLPRKYKMHRFTDKGIEVYNEKLKKISSLELFYLRFYSVYRLLLCVYRGRRMWERSYFWDDNLRIPFNRNIRCKFAKHSWEYLDEGQIYCKYCNKKKNIDYIQWQRIEKMKKIKKGIKK